MVDITRTQFPILQTKNGLKKQAYGIDFAPNTPDYMIELHCCFRYKLDKFHGGLGVTGHFWNYVEILYPEFCHRDNYFMDTFFDNILSDLYQFYFVIGPGGFGKTTLAALYVIGAWIENPTGVGVITATTTAESAEGRIWGKVKHLFNKHPHFKKFAKVTEKKIYFMQKQADGTTEKDTFHGMKLAPLPKGTSGADSVMRGIHPDKKLIVILDEMDQSAAIDDVVENLQKGGVDFTLIGLGNPSDRFSALGLSCEPFGGWDSIDPFGFEKIEDCSWDSVIDEGRVLFFPGYLNPRIKYAELYPEKAEYYNNRFAYFTTQQEIDEKKKTIAYNKWMEQLIGFFPEQNTAGMQYLIDKQDLRHSKAHEKAIFSGHSQPVLFAAADVSFTSGGDQNIVRYATLGILDNGKKGLCFGGPESITRIQIPKTLNENKYRWIAQAILKDLQAHGVKPEHFAIDINSAGDAILEYLFELWSHDIYAITSRGAASERPLYRGTTITARDECSNKVTEYWLMMKKFIISHQIRGLDQTTIHQLTSRAILSKPGSMKLTLEPKGDYKKRMTSIGRTGKSPDEADAAAYILDNARNFGFLIDHDLPENSQDNSRLRWENAQQEAEQEMEDMRNNSRRHEAEREVSNFYDDEASDHYSIATIDIDAY